MQQHILGQRHVIEQIFCAFLSKGHILMTGVPGLGKTRMIQVFAQYLGKTFRRIQYTPDLLPSDITGSEILQPSQTKRMFEFVPGPIFANLVLADEINRASPRTQAAMLEAMQEYAVTVGGKTYPLPDPFMVCATQNPIESEGTYPLPEAQLDRFLLHTLIDYPDKQAELNILQNHQALTRKHVSDHHILKADAWSEDTYTQIMQHAQKTKISSTVYEMINDLVRATREPLERKGNHRELIHGAGPRGGLALVIAAKSWALIQEEEEVRWRHVKDMVYPVLRHRLHLSARFRDRYPDPDAYIDTLLQHFEDRYSLTRRS